MSLLAVAAVLNSRSVSQSRSEALYRALQEAGYDAGILMGGFFFAVAVALALQTYSTSQRGYVYSGVTTQVYRAKDLRGYRLWAIVQWSGVAVLATAGSVFMLLL